MATKLERAKEKSLKDWYHFVLMELGFETNCGSCGFCDEYLKLIDKDPYEDCSRCPVYKIEKMICHDTYWYREMCAIEDYLAVMVYIHGF